VANEIKGLIVHQFEKATHAAGRIVPRESVIAATEPVHRLVDALHTLYGEKAGKCYGKFEDDEDTYPMQRRVRAYFAEERDDFFAFSLAAMNILKGKADDAPLSTGGYVLMAHLFNDARDFLLFAIVTNTVGSAITDNLDIEDRAHLDLNKFRVAGQIDLTAWAANDEPYIGFLKGPKSTVSGYFKHFLGCHDTIQPKQETQKLSKALKQFAQQQLTDKTERAAWLAQALDFCTSLSKNEEPFSIEEFSNRLWPKDPVAVRKVLAHHELKMSDGFVPNRQALKSLTKFKATTRLWTFEFDREALGTGEVSYDRARGTLTLLKLPDKFKRELDDELADKLADE